MQMEMGQVVHPGVGVTDFDVGYCGLMNTELYGKLGLGYAQFILAKLPESPAYGSLQIIVF